MIGGQQWKPDKLFFFDKSKRIRWQKRQKKPMDSLPITLQREARPSVTFAGDKFGFLKGKKEQTFIRTEDRIDEEGENSVSEGQEKKLTTRRQKVLELEYDEDEDTQRFLFEEAKFSAPNLLAQIEKFLVYLLRQKSNEREELDQLNEEIEAVYGPEWGHNYHEEERNALEIPDDLYKRLCYDYEQFVEGTLYVVRKWQTSVYRELAALQELRSSHHLIDFQSLTSSPDLALIKSLSQERQRGPAEEREKKSEKMLATLAVNDGNSPKADNEQPAEGPPVTSIGRESRVSGSTIKPKTRLEKFKLIPDKDRSSRATNFSSQPADRERTPRAGHAKINVGPHESYEDDFASIKAWEANFERNILSNQAQNFLPGSVINFSLSSKTCHDKGWINKKIAAEDLEQKSILEWVAMRLRQSMKQKEEEEIKADLLDENGSLVKRDYGDAKRETTIKYKQGVALAKFLSQKKNEAPKRFLTTLPDGSTCCFYQSGRVAAISSKCKAGNHGFYTFAYSDEPMAKTLACFTPTGKGCCNFSEKTIRFLVTSKEAFFNDENGIPVKKWKWAYGKMMSPETIQLSDNISIRCVSQHSIVMTVNIEGEIAKFHVSPFAEASEQDPENLGYLMTSESFISRGAAQSLQPRKKITREERRAKNQKREALKNINPGISEESLAERLKDLDEKFPERKDMDLDAPFLLELHKLQRKIKNIVFDWMEHYRSSLGISRQRKLSLLMKKKQRMNSANSLPGSMPSFPRRPNSSLQRAPSAPPLPKSLKSRMDSKGMRLNGEPDSFQENAKEKRAQSTDSALHRDDAGASDFRLEVPQLPKTTETARRPKSTSPISRKAFTSDSARLKTPRPLLLPKEGCPVSLHMEMVGIKDPHCRCDKRRIPCISDLEYDVFISEHVPSTQLVVVSIVSSRIRRSPCDDMLDDLYYEKNKAQNLPCAQSRYEPYRLLRYDLATSSYNSETPLLLRRHNVAPGMFLMYVGGKLMFADYIFNGYGNAKRDFLNQILKTRKDSMTGNGLAQDFRFNTRPISREPRTAWGGELGVPFHIGYSATIDSWQNGLISDFDGLPALLPKHSESNFFFKEKNRGKNQTPLLSYNRLTNMHF